METAPRTIYEIGADLGPDDEPVFRHQQARMFRWAWMEPFSMVPVIVPAILYVPVVAWFAWQGLGIGGLGALPAVLGGLLFWSLLEYLLHRFLFHIRRRGPISRFVYLTFHGVHHFYPDDPLRLVMVPTVSLPLALLFGGLFSSLLPAGTWQLAFAGLVLGYLNYDYSHWATHYLKLPKSPIFAPLAAILRVQKRRHMRHHYGDHTKGYGVSTGLWDHVFGTVDPELRA